jgi:hypothetical protein
VNEVLLQSRTLGFNAKSLVKCRVRDLATVQVQWLECFIEYCFDVAPSWRGHKVVRLWRHRRISLLRRHLRAGHKCVCAMIPLVINCRVCAPTPGNYSWSKLAVKGSPGARCAVAHVRDLADGLHSAGHSLSFLNAKNLIYVFGGGYAQ